MKPVDAKKAPTPNQFGKFFRDLRAELRKVTWPTWKETRTYFVVVILTIIAFGVVFFLFDVFMLKTFFKWLAG